MSVAAARSPLTKDDFPAALVDAVGEENLAAMPELQVETDTDNFTDCFNLGPMMPNSGSLKGTDQHGRVYILFCINDPSVKLIRILSVFQKFNNQPAKEEGVFEQRNFKTDGDKRISEGTLMNPDKYAAIKEIFQGTHASLTLARDLRSATV
ncbi:MAG: hypothetical protein HY069_04650 [Chlamydiia bacterium]|nr:hypothetical protein [Chlamydiia bacterium]